MHDQLTTAAEGIRAGRFGATPKGEPFAGHITFCPNSFDTNEAIEDLLSPWNVQINEEA